MDARHACVRMWRCVSRAPLLHAPAPPCCPPPPLARAGLPGLTEEGWAGSLAAALEAQPHHISVYDLQVEEGTPCARRYSPGVAPLPSDDAGARMLAAASAALAGAGGWEGGRVCSGGCGGCLLCITLTHVLPGCCWCRV